MQVLKKMWVVTDRTVHMSKECFRKHGTSLILRSLLKNITANIRNTDMFERILCVICVQLLHSDERKQTGFSEDALKFCEIKLW